MCSTSPFFKLIYLCWWWLMNVEESSLGWNNCIYHLSASSTISSNVLPREVAVKIHAWKNTGPTLTYLPHLKKTTHDSESVLMEENKLCFFSFRKYTCRWQRNCNFFRYILSKSFAGWEKLGTETQDINPSTSWSKKVVSVRWLFCTCLCLSCC